MSFELLPTVTPWLVAFVALAVVTLVVAVAAITEFVVSNRKVRVSRHESMRSYYGRLALSH